MSFSIERYKEESKKLDTTGVAWADVTAHPLSKGDLFCLHYMMDIENHVPLYLSHLLVTRACMDPILTAFLACWNYEELWHGENLGKLLNLYGIEFDTQDRIARVRANLGLQNSISILTTMAGSWLSKDFSAVYLSIGAINELSTLTGYAALIRPADADHQGRAPSLRLLLQLSQGVARGQREGPALRSLDAGPGVGASRQRRQAPGGGGCARPLSLRR